jgi:glutamate:Na+ symporter, ESS family
MTTYDVVGADVLIIAIIVWFLGEFLTKKYSFLSHYNIPSAVTGGLICSLIITFIYAVFDIQINFDMRIRDLMLLIFFTTIGLSAKFTLLKAGGKALAILLGVATVFLVLQDLTGVLLVTLIGENPAYGLFGGSISFAGGYGTAIAWGDVAEQGGLVKAKEIGIAFATFGLIAGGVIGGPIAQYLIRKHKIQTNTNEITSKEDKQKLLTKPVHISGVLGSLLVLAICMEIGDLVNRMLFSNGVTLPGFLTAMMIGIVITNSADLFKFQLNEKVIDRAAEISLQIFLSMSLMSMQLWVLSQAVGPILLVLIAQVLVMTIFAVHVIFRVMGKDYDASVIASGFAGLGLGATPVGIANMNAITTKYGPSPKAFLVIPLVGAFFIDIVNALVIKFFANLPIISQTGISF